MYSCLSYEAHKLHLFCTVLCHLWPVWLYLIFTHYLKNSMISRGGINTEHKICVLIFSTSLVLNTSHSRTNFVTYHICT